MPTIPDVSQRVVERTAESVEERNRFTLRRPMTGMAKLARKMTRQPTEFTIHLDELGSAAWRLFDGRRTVAQVRAELERMFPQQDDVPRRLGKFLSELVSRGFVRLS